jgi:hypothetical protein
MRRRSRSVCLCAVILCSGCIPAVQAPPEIPGPEVGGLTAADFRLISQGGFDPADNEADRNDYAWAMEYFQADGADRGYLYVGTGNAMVSVVLQGITSILTNSPVAVGNVATHPPEIRRYREDQGPLEWERVLDYRDAGPNAGGKTIGFRDLKSYRSAHDGVNYLYAATMSENAVLWRSGTGDPGSWEVVWQSGSEGSVRMMTEHNGILYLALANEVPGTVQVAKIWATDGRDFWPVMEDAFGNPDNTGLMCLASYNGWLYAGTMNKAHGFEVWRLEGPDGQAEPVQVVAHGGPSPLNQAAISPCVFQNKLYMGVQIHPDANYMRRKAADMIRIDENDRWETIVGPSSLSGYDSGFSHWPNAYIWSIGVYKGWMYASTYDQATTLANILGQIGLMILPDPPVLRFWWAAPEEKRLGGGADLYKTQDGVIWYPITLDGLGDRGNYGIRGMVTHDDVFYIGTANPYTGLEMWAAGP